VPTFITIAVEPINPPFFYFQKSSNGPKRKPDARC
jgi:hypothetical protein